MLNKPSKVLAILSTFGALACLAATVGLAQPATAQEPAAEQSAPELANNPSEKSMTTKIRGPFDVKTLPQAQEAGHEKIGIGRMLLDKTFHGDLDASSLGQMLAFRSAVAGSAGYVAMEQVTGTLGGRQGSFVLQHYGTMSGEGQHLDLSVTPDSGTDGLVGLSGNMAIIIEEGKHFYEFEYTLPSE